MFSQKFGTSPPNCTVSHFNTINLVGLLITVGTSNDSCRYLFGIYCFFIHYLRLCSVKKWDNWRIINGIEFRKQLGYGTDDPGFESV
jgi:hypothetical protein